MKEIKNNFIYYLILIVAFFLLPLLFIKEEGGQFIGLLLGVFPITSLLLSMIYGKNNGVKWYFSLILGLLFLATIFIYYNESAIIYAFVYGIISIIGQALGYKIDKLIENL